MIALVEAVRSGLFSRKNAFQNVCAGIVVGVVSIPLSMAFAISSNVKPEVGLHTAMIAALCVSILGGSRVQISGPTGAFIGVLVSISSQFGFDGLQLATIMAGCMLMIMGVAKVGKVIKFIPEQVIIGFTSGLAVNLFIGQLPNFLGLTCDKLPVDFGGKLSCIAQALPSISIPTTAVACASLLILIFSKKTPLRVIPGPILALIFGMTVQFIFKFESLATIGSAFGGMPSSLPRLHLPPDVSLHRITSLLSSAFAIAMLGAIESLLSAVIIDRMTSAKHSLNQDLIGQGIGNIVAPLFGGIASTGSLARTISSVNAGGNSPLAGIVSSITLLFTICFCAPLATNIPLATLAAIIFMVAYNMSCAKSFVSTIVHAPKLDAVTLIVTFLLTIVCGIVFAVNVGVVLSALILMYRLSAVSDVSCEQCKEFRSHHIASLPHEIAVYSIHGPLFFGMTDKFEDTINGIACDVKVLILRMQRVSFIDTSGLQELHVIIDRFASNGRKIIICEAQDAVAKRLHRSQILDSTGAENYGQDIEEAIRIAKKIYGTISGENDMFTRTTVHHRSMHRKLPRGMR
ncbi:MAG: STAS domain-containing protein [Puniceicoccales bacterium]|jgi:SulP family sulfate permease|nr:STAS domain-containing protein [Puniceicoccales bacterium]